MAPFETRLKRMIAENGPVDTGTFMALAGAHYYATRDPFGRTGDFTTAPEISQLFGDMIGAFLADAWLRCGAPSPVLLAEAGPGRGTLMADILRATKKVPGFHDAVRVHLIETSPVLAARQAETLAGVNVTIHDSLDGMPDDAPLFFVANEFLDALPLRQFQKENGAWHERVVGLRDDRLVFGLVPSEARFDGAEGDIVEHAPARDDFVEALSLRLKRQGGVALLIDYGYDRSAPGDTLQAMRGHAYADVLNDVGECDLTAHVDFEAVVRAASRHVKTHGPVGQGAFLTALGIDLRAARLGLAADRDRLVAADAMGELFRVVALCTDADFQPAGFSG